MRKRSSSYHRVCRHDAEGAIWCVLTGWFEENGPVKNSKGRAYFVPCLYQNANLLLLVAPCDSFLNFPPLPNARFLIMLRLSQLLHYAFLVTLFLEPTQRLFKRLVLLNPYLCHPTTTPLLQVELCTPLSATRHSLTEFVTAAIMPACILGLSSGDSITRLNSLSRETVHPFSMVWCFASTSGKMRQEVGFLFGTES